MELIGFVLLEYIYLCLAIDLPLLYLFYADPFIHDYSISFAIASRKIPFVRFGVILSEVFGVCQSPCTTKICFRTCVCSL